jgi:hypothetical protein
MSPIDHFTAEAGARSRGIGAGDRVAAPQPQRRMQGPASGAQPPGQPLGIASTGAAHPGPEPGSPGLCDELSSALGLPLTRGNAVWGGNALEKLRGLQHILMKYAFTLPHDQRGPLLQAVKVLELAVALRLRFEACLLAEQALLQRCLPGDNPWAAGREPPPPAIAPRPRVVA